MNKITDDYSNTLEFVQIKVSFQFMNDTTEIEHKKKIIYETIDALSS